MMYYLGNGFCVAKIPKAYSCSIAVALAKAYYPEIWNELYLTPALCRDVIPQTETPVGTIYVVLRDEKERFISTCAMLQLSIEEGLESTDPHFVDQKSFIIEGAVVCTLAELEKHTGLSIPVVNLGLHPKPVPDDKQKKTIETKLNKRREL